MTQAAASPPATSQVLAHVAEAHLAQWLAESGASVAFASAGAFFLTDWPTPQQAAAVSAHPLCRYALPVEVAWPITPRKKLNLVAATRALSPLLNPSDGTPPQVVRVAAVHHAMGHLACALQASLTAHRQADLPQPPSPPQTPTRAPPPSSSPSTPTGSGQAASAPATRGRGRPAPPRRWPGSARPRRAM